ncbi:hypothetical protein F2Q69_00003542 [Brassica cretica]|uniref:Uncharacterized protein n=1 Tax=Brassica cretica TaxID=69181 RepID=A0A8S9PCC7_BRACR|nr:hypothetical protein F2Q69_00003542 [Brassica cretica]
MIRTARRGSKGNTRSGSENEISEKAKIPRRLTDNPTSSRETLMLPREHWEGERREANLILAY